MTHIKSEETGNSITITINGDFTFSVNRSFRDVYRPYEGRKHFIIDLTKATYMDSAGLGMLIRLREFSGNDHGQVKIISNEDIYRILQVAQFDQLFTLELAPETDANANVA